MHPLSALHIGVDAKNVLTDRRGIGRYVKALLRRWYAREDVRISLLVPWLFTGFARAALARALDVADIADVVVYRPRDAARRGCDIVWYPWNGMDWTTALPAVATVHDVWPFAAPASDQRRRAHQQAPFRTTATSADRIITDSLFSKAEIIRHLHVDADEISVVPLGVDMPSAAQKEAAAVRPRLDGAERYVLFVGEVEERKQLPTVVAAFAFLPSALQARLGLVVVGKTQRSQRSVGVLERGAAPVLRFQPKDGVNTLLTGEVDDRLLAQLYANAAAFVLPSSYEGFGLPLLEAMAYGAPAIASSAASLPETGADAALYFPSGDAVTLAQRLRAVVDDEGFAASLRAKGFARASAMSWDACAAQTLAIVRATAFNRSSAPGTT